MTQTGASESDSQSYGKKSGESGHNQETRGSGKTINSGSAETDARSNADTKGRSETLVPIHDNFEEVTSVDYYSFEEHSIEWGQKIRSLRTGEAILQLPNQSGVQRVKVDYFELENTVDSEKAIQELVQRNFESEFFMPISEAKQRHEECLQNLLAGNVSTVPGKLLDAPSDLNHENDQDSGPFSL